jgi:hypothetical protein
VTDVAPMWHRPLRTARQRAKRIESATDKKVREFEERQGRVSRATERAERAAIELMMRSDDLARSVAQHE